MKTKFFALLLLSLCLACGKEHDPKLVGSWSGTEKNRQFDNTTKSWIQNGYKDGTYDIVFSIVKDCHTSTQVETGTWWTDNSEFFEMEKHQTAAQIYGYEILNDLNVRFKLKRSGEGYTDPDYIFIDTKFVHND